MEDPTEIISKMFFDGFRDYVVKMLESKYVQTKKNKPLFLMNDSNNYYLLGKAGGTAHKDPHNLDFEKNSSIVNCNKLKSPIRDITRVAGQNHEINRSASPLENSPQNHRVDNID